jgi:hypothetical protein
MDQPVEVPYAVVQAMGDIVPTEVTEGTDGRGQPVMIQRYVAKSDGRIFDCVFRLDEQPLCYRRLPGDDAVDHNR